MYGERKKITLIVYQAPISVNMQFRDGSCMLLVFMRFGAFIAKIQLYALNTIIFTHIHTHSSLCALQLTHNLIPKGPTVATQTVLQSWASWPPCTICVAKVGHFEIKLWVNSNAHRLECVYMCVNMIVFKAYNCILAINALKHIQSGVANYSFAVFFLSRNLSAHA